MNYKSSLYNWNYLLSIFKDGCGFSAQETVALPGEATLYCLYAYTGIIKVTLE
jgi:hypothetical protein